MYALSNSSTHSQYLGGLPPLTTTQNKMILSQLEKTVCKIHKSDGTKASGFLCRIPFPDKNRLLPVLITNNHILNKDDIQLNKSIKITLGDNEIEKFIKLDKSRIVYTSSDVNIDVTIIEIKPKTDSFKDFLEIDENIFATNYEDFYRKKPIYILQYPKGKESSHSEGVINNINNKNIEHTCSVDFCSSGAPILRLSNFKVIGVQKGKIKYNYNEGTLIKFIINDFYKKYVSEKPQQINSNQNNNNAYHNNMQQKNQMPIANNIVYANPNTYIIPQMGYYAYYPVYLVPQYNYYLTPNVNAIPANNNNFTPLNQNYNQAKMQNFGYNQYNEIINESNVKEFSKNSNGGLVTNYAFYECQNNKNKNNINFKSIENFNGDKNQILFCLFNGHGGDQVSIFLQENFANYMKKILPMKDESKDLTNLFRALDIKIKELNLPNTGSTGTIVYMDNQNGKRRLYCANVGNNRCLLLSKRGIVKLSNDHNINDPEEHKRILRKGGILNTKELFGKLSSSRAFGHWSIKKFGGVISDPHITVINLNKDDYYLIIGSEKIWKYIKDEECFKFANNKVPLEICKRMGMESNNRGCRANIGTIVVSFH